MPTFVLTLCIIIIHEFCIILYYYVIHTMLQLTAVQLHSHNFFQKLALNRLTYSYKNYSNNEILIGRLALRFDVILVVNTHLLGFEPSFSILLVLAEGTITIHIVIDQVSKTRQHVLTST